MIGGCRNIKELQSLNDETLSQPSVSPQFFPAMGAHKYWSSTSLPNQTTRAWYLFMRFGITTYDLKTAKDKVLCGRGVLGATTAAPEISGVGFRVFPTLFSSKIHVEPYDPAAVFQLFDCYGRLVFSGKNMSEQDFSGLPGGLYLLKISGKNTAALRLVKI